MSNESKCPGHNRDKCVSCCWPAQSSTGYTAVDMTTAAAQGFRDGAASVVVELPKYDAIVMDRAIDIPSNSDADWYIIRQVYQSLHRKVQAAIIAAGGTVKE